MPSLPSRAAGAAGAAKDSTVWLIVRRICRLNPATVPPGHSELFAAHRYHAAFTDSPEPLPDAESILRDHAIIEQVIADLKHCAGATRPRPNSTPTAPG